MDKEETLQVSRRGFLKAGVGLLSTLALLEIGGGGLLFLRARSLEGQYGGLVTVGAVDEFPPGSVTEFQDSHFFLVRAPEGGFLAVHSRCTHLGCTVNWVPAEDRFVCPCHAAAFDFYGTDEGPPVPRPLDLFPIEFKDELVRVDTSQPQRRESFDTAQLIYAPRSLQPASSSQGRRATRG